jgi:hypothetical protein
LAKLGDGIVVVSTNVTGTNGALQSVAPRAYADCQSRMT